MADCVKSLADEMFAEHGFYRNDNYGIGAYSKDESYRKNTRIFLVKCNGYIITEYFNNGKCGFVECGLDCDLLDACVQLVKEMREKDDS